MYQEASWDFVSVSINDRVRKKHLEELLGDHSETSKVGPLLIRRCAWTSKLTGG